MSDYIIYIISWLVSVIIMTLFSALISQLSGNEYREPNLLSKLISGNELGIKEKPFHIVMGWVIHFSIGLLFFSIYTLLYQFTDQMKSMFWTCLIGFLFGGIGILGWTIAFKISSNPPNIEFKGFSLQLLFAHIIFCICIWQMLNLLL